jgi:protein-S-isoprenylcysteine O-methyltransferase Ste14
MPDEQHLTVWFIDSAWSLWALIWVVLSRGVKKAVRRESVASRAGHLVPLAVAAVLLAVDWSGTWLGAPLLPRAPWMAPAGAAVTSAGLLFALWARLTIGANWSGTVTVKESHALVQTGPYALARHPIYTGLLLAFVGTAVAIDAWRGTLAFLLAAGSFLRKMQTEEAFMIDTFGAAYVSYRARVAALVPFVW